MKQRIFISSVQKEFADERQALKAYILGDALLSRFFDVFLFEDIPASDRRANADYIDPGETSPSSRLGAGEPASCRAALPDEIHRTNGHRDG